MIILVDLIKNNQETRGVKNRFGVSFTPLPQRGTRCLVKIQIKN